MLTTKGNKNAIIEFLRFFAITAIVFFHIETYYFHAYFHFDYAYIFVEFFFILTGFLTMMKISKKDNFTNTEVFELFKQKIKTFYVPYLLAFIISFLIICVYIEKIKISEIFLKILSYKWEILGLQNSGLIYDIKWDKILNIPAWYISSLIIAFALFCILATKFRKVFIFIIAPISAFLTYSTFINQFSTLDLNIQVTNICGFFVQTGNMRAFAGMSVGAIFYYLYKKIIEKEIKIKTKILATVVEVILIFSLVYLFVFNYLIKKEDLLFYIPIFGILIMLGFSNLGFISNLLSRYFNKIFGYLGGLSLYIFLLQFPIIKLFERYFNNLGYAKGILSIYVVTIAFSAILKGIFDVVKKEKK